MKTTVRRREILILADGDSVAARSSAKGHLFEQFVARWLEQMGYESPTVGTINVTSSGVELDLSARHSVSSVRCIAECKAYQAPLSSESLMTFYGKLCSERLDSADLEGFFVAIPGLTADAAERARSVSSRDSRFRAIPSDELVMRLRERGLIPPSDWHIAAGASVALEDDVLVVSEAGLFVAARMVSVESGLADRIIVSAIASVPRDPAVLRLLGGTDFAAGLSCEYFGSEPRLAQPTSPAVAEQSVVEVRPGGSDFEYQLPAGPRFFVGRKALLARLHPTGLKQGRVVVLHSKSGSGKSSFALRLAEAFRQNGGVGICVDTRTATGPAFFGASLRHALLRAVNAGVLELPSDASFSSPRAVVNTLRESRFSGPVLVFFDQFENVFRERLLAQSYRDLALELPDLQAEFVVGFAWKSDLVGFTESFPYAIRDDLRSAGESEALAPFGAEDVNEVLTRLQKSYGGKLHRDLLARVREYSQGLPWLLKKLGSHLLGELTRGATQDELLAEALNVQLLFERDLESLTPKEREGLRNIARRVPLGVTDASDIAGGAAVLESLINRRFLVSIGETVDVYWDIFRDFLVSGTTPIKDGYILRITPATVGRVLALVSESPGGVSTEDAARRLRSTPTAMMNIARDLRQLGVLSAVAGKLRLVSELEEVEDKESATRAKVASALRRHRAFDVLVDLAGGDRTSRGRFAEVLQMEYPGVPATPKTWVSYARAFLLWAEVAGLVTLEDEAVSIAGEARVSRVRLFEAGHSRLPRGTVVFPRASFEAVRSFLNTLAGRHGLPPGPKHKGRADAFLLGLSRLDGRDVVLTEEGSRWLEAKGPDLALSVRQALEKREGFQVVLQILERDPAAKPVSLGNVLGNMAGATWSSGHCTSVGKYCRSWARAAGVRTVMRRPR